MTNSAYTVIARLSRAHGVHGAIKVESYTNPPEAILNYRKLFCLKEEPPLVLEVGKSKMQDESAAIIKFKNITTREAAEALAGAPLGVLREQMPPLEDDEYYWNDLIGLLVSDKEAGEIGPVENIFEVGAGPILVVKKEGSDQEILLPFNEQTIVEINLPEARILMDLPLGILEL